MLSTQFINSSKSHKAKGSKFPKPAEILQQRLHELLKSIHSVNAVLPQDIPKKWEKHGDLVLIPSRSLQDPMWENHKEQALDILCNTLKCRRVARKHTIMNNDFRSPQMELLRGNDGWVNRVDNGIKITFDVTKCMFSAGNISEKLRISKFDCHGEIVVDLYAGIGYFTLPYLVHAKADLVHACEWNPDAIEALQRNLTLNNVAEKCVIHVGDNKLVCPKGIADRVNLGLIPSSKESWLTACAALKPDSGGILHIHEVVDLREEFEFCSEFVKGDQRTILGVKQKPLKWAMSLCSSLKNILWDVYQNDWTILVLHVEFVKSYAPHLDHLVADLQCKPSHL